jgi:glutamyl-tRNA(Gln) amidotransferase subunit E
MSKLIDKKENFQQTQEEISYVKRKEATQADYDRIGFMSGLEVHQQIDTKKKLFCNCPAGIFHKDNEYDAEVIRHMRPTLSELGEYDGTALMEFKTRKEITYKLNNETACTYEVDDTPPFPLNREALEKSIEISLLSKLNVVGEVHVTRKQYLDGSIPTGFQRTAIIGVEGEIELPYKKIRLIQLSLEEDSCREISDIGHKRVYKTDRLGMPLIETVTYPDFVNPDEVKDGCDFIRFLNRSTNKVRTGMGAGRQDVNVSCKGGHRVEIKGVAHTKWIPELTHREAFRQFALLNIKSKLEERKIDKENWKISHCELNKDLFIDLDPNQQKAIDTSDKIIAVNLPGFANLLSHFVQEGKEFATEFSQRLKVIACIEHPNMTHSEAIENAVSEDVYKIAREKLNASENDAQIIFWALEADVKTALETIEERALMTFDGVPPETRKGFEDGSTIFERVLPGADRMYPDTDTAPISLKNEYIEKLNENLPIDVIDMYRKMMEWGIPQDTYTYILKKNLFPLIAEIDAKLKINPKFVGVLLGHKLKNIEGRYKSADDFDYKEIFRLLEYLVENNIELNIAEFALKELYQHPKMDSESILNSIPYKQKSKSEILDKIPYLKNKFDETAINLNEENKIDWIVGQMRKIALGNISFNELVESIKK